jgi:hypothetical protein
VRAVAADGAAAYRTALAADVRARRAAGLQLLAGPRATAAAPAARAMLAFVRAQRAPFLPAKSGLSAGPGAETVLTAGSAAPSPLGLLQAQG